MKVVIKLDIPEKSVYAGVVTDALHKIADYWDEGARNGDLSGEAGDLSWDSTADDEIGEDEPAGFPPQGGHRSFPGLEDIPLYPAHDTVREMTGEDT
jgi:hypothetical protein